MRPRDLVLIEPLRRTLRACRKSDTPATRTALREVIHATVDVMRAEGEPVEAIIRLIKQATGDTDTPRERDALAMQAVTWCTDYYFDAP
ncbi:MAG: hypothetical protein ABJE47_24935 [bacterium]